MSYYHECPDCGLNLDPGETCDCKEKAPSEAATSAESEPIIPASIMRQ